MAQASKDFDRTVHAVCEDGREIVRYDRAGKWYIECRDGKRRPVSLREAAAVAAEARLGHGDVFYGRAGGGRFDKVVADIVILRPPA